MTAKTLEQKSTHFLR